MPLPIKPSRRLWTALPWLSLMVLCILITVAVFSCNARIKEIEERKSREEKALKPRISVVTQVIRPELMTDRINLPAKVMAWEDLTVKAEVNGKVVSVPVREGDIVGKGDVLVEIDNRDYANILAATRAKHELAQENYTRLKKLAVSNSVAQAQFDEADAALKELNAALKTAELNVARCTITAPISGVVNNLPARLGMLIAHADPVVQLLKIDRLKVEVAVPESEVNAVRDVNESTLTFAALDNLRVTAQKIFLASQPSFPSLVYILRLALDNPGSILPGMFGRADLIKGIFPQAIGIPLYAVITQGDEKYVFTVDKDNFAHKVKVRTGFLEGWKVRILSGIEPGDQVVIVGHRSLDEGQPVKVAKSLTNPENL